MNKESFPESDDKVLEKVSNELKTKLSKAGSWIYSSDGLKITKILSSLSSFVVGDPIGFLLPMIIEASDIAIRKRFLKHFPDLLNRLEKNKTRIVSEYVRSEEGQQLLKDVLLGLIKQADSEKAEYLKKFLNNSFVKSGIKDAIKQQYLTTLLTLSPIELQILHILHSPNEVIKEMYETMESVHPNFIQYSLKQDIRNYLGLDEILFRKSVSNLARSDCIDEKGREVYWSSGGYESRYRDDLINRATRDAKSLVTVYGNNFVKFVTTEL